MNLTDLIAIIMFAFLFLFKPSKQKAYKLSRYYHDMFVMESR